MLSRSSPPERSAWVDVLQQDELEVAGSSPSASSISVPASSHSVELAVREVLAHGGHAAGAAERWRRRRAMTGRESSLSDRLLRIATGLMVSTGTSSFSACRGSGARPASSARNTPAFGPCTDSSTSWKLRSGVSGAFRRALGAEQLVPLALAVAALAGQGRAAFDAPTGAAARPRAAAAASGRGLASRRTPGAISVMSSRLGWSASSTAGSCRRSAVQLARWRPRRRARRPVARTAPSAPAPRRPRAPSAAAARCRQSPSSRWCSPRRFATESGAGPLLVLLALGELGHQEADLLLELNHRVEPEEGVDDPPLRLERAHQASSWLRAAFGLPLCSCTSSPPSRREISSRPP